MASTGAVWGCGAGFSAFAGRSAFFVLGDLPNRVDIFLRAPMASRIRRVMRRQGLTEEEIFEAMTKKSGLLGISGVGRDLRYLMDAKEQGNERAALAVDFFINSILHYIGAYAAEMGGIDNLVFTGGIGENSVYVREKVCEKLGFLGVVMDHNANERPNSDGIRRITKEESRVNVLVIPADEEIVVGRKTYEAVKGA